MRLIATKAGNRVIVCQFYLEGESEKAFYFNRDGEIDSADISDFTVAKEETLALGEAD